jgi:hypothetical protein
VRKHIIIFCVLTAVFLPWNELAADEEENLGIFVCVDGPLRIRAGAGLAYEITGKLETGERVAITAKSDYQDNIDGQKNYWYRIRRNDIQGYVFGGYGIVIADKIVIKSIDDFADKLSFTSNKGGEMAAELDQIKVRFSSMIKLFGKKYEMKIECRPLPRNSPPYVTVPYLMNKYNLGGGSDHYSELGPGESYKILSGSESGTVEKRYLENRYEPTGVFFLTNWKYISPPRWAYNDSSDIMAIFFKNDDINAEFDEILITVCDAYRGAVPDDLNAGMILSNRDKLIPELMVYQLLYEYFRNIQIDIKYTP